MAAQALHTIGKYSARSHQHSPVPATPIAIHAAMTHRTLTPVPAGDGTIATASGGAGTHGNRSSRPVERADERT